MNAPAQLIDGSEHEPTELLTCGQVSDLLGVSTDWVRRRVQQRAVEHVRLGRNVRFTRTQVHDLIEKYTRKP